MLQKYFPILGEVNSPLAMMAALNLTAGAAKITMQGVSNETLESLVRNAIASTPTYHKEVVVAASELAAARVAASKAIKGLRYRAAQAARKARSVSKVARRVKAVKKPATAPSLKALKGLSIEICRQRAVSAQSAVRVAANNYSTANEAVEKAIEGGDIRSIRSAVAALKVAVRTLEVRQLELRFAREMLAISLARHSA